MKLFFYQLVGAYILVSLGCSNAGNRNDKNSSRPPIGDNNQNDQEKEEARPKIDIGLGLLNEKLALPPRCAQPVNSSAVLDLQGHFKLDGSTGDWGGVPQILTDVKGDHRDGLDLNSVYFAANKTVSRDDLVGAVTFSKDDVAAKLAAGHSILIEFGQMGFDEENALTMKAARLYRIQNDGVYEFDATLGWSDSALDTSQADYAVNGNTLEWRLRKREIDHVIANSLWWVRTFSRSSKDSDRFKDSTAASYFHNYYQTTPSKSLKIQHCAAASNSKINFRFQQIMLGNIKGTFNPYMLGLVGFAYEQVQRVVGYRSFPFSDLPVLLTEEKLNPDVDLLDGETGRDHFGVHLRYTEALELAIKSGNYHQQFREIAEQLAEWLLAWKYPDSDQYFRSIVRQAVVDRIMREALGVSYWLSAYSENVNLFLQKGDDPLNIPLEARIERLEHPFDDEESRQLYAAVTASKALAFGSLLGSRLPSLNVVSAWEQSATAGANTGASLRKAILAVDPASPHQQFIEAVWQGWIENTNYVGKYSQQSLRDRDADGLPNFYEQFIGSNEQLIDTDGDGWSDLAEVVSGTEFLSSATKPNRIIADGYFADWQELLPGSIRTKETSLKPGCPTASLLNAFIAVGSGSRLIIAASTGASPKESDVPVSWEIELKTMRSRRQLLVVGARGEHRMQVFDVSKDKVLINTIDSAVPFASKAFEVLVDFAKLGLSDDLSKSGAVRIKIRSTVSEPQSKICDSSPAFLPLVSSSEN